jgi:hypothetical protein
MRKGHESVYNKRNISVFIYIVIIKCREKNQTFNTHIHDLSLSGLDTYISIEGGEVKL